MENNNMPSEKGVMESAVKLDVDGVDSVHQLENCSGQHQPDSGRNDS